MKKICPTCGKLHEFAEKCPIQVEREKQRKAEYEQSKYSYDNSRGRNSLADKFRNTKQWQRKRKEIRDRDLNICRYCFLCKQKITTAALSVHHIVPLEKNYDLRLSNGNLITLCHDCHEKAESGKITADLLRKIVKMAIKL